MFSNLFGHGAAQAGKSAGYANMAIMLVIWAAIFYLFLILPNKKKKKKRLEMMTNLQPGKEVVTNGGIKGEVISVNDEYVVIRVDKGVRMTFVKEAIRVIL